MKDTPNPTAWMAITPTGAIITLSLKEECITNPGSIATTHVPLGKHYSTVSKSLPNKSTLYFMTIIFKLLLMFNN